MSEGFIDRLEEGPVKEWYVEVQKKLPKEFAKLNSILKEFEQGGYVLDPNSGLYFHPDFGDKDGVTQGKIVFPRPVDLHYHKDVGEKITVLSEEGGFFGRGLINQNFLIVYKGESINYYIDEGHSFAPMRHSCPLEIELTCSGILDPKKEICLTPFNKYWGVGLGE